MRVRRTVSETKLHRFFPYDSGFRSQLAFLLFNIYSAVGAQDPIPDPPELIIFACIPERSAFRSANHNLPKYISKQFELTRCQMQSRMIILVGDKVSHHNQPREEVALP